MMRLISLYFFFLVFLLFHIDAQINTTFLDTPFVSRVRVEVEEGKVRLYWKDSPNPEIKKYNIYRSILPFTNENFSKAELIGTVDAGVEGFTDQPAQAGEYFYSILAVKENGDVVQLFVPFRNLTTTALLYTPPVPTGQVNNVSARVVGERVIIDFQATDATANVIIFRTTIFPESREDLANGIMIATLPGTTTNYQDLPPQGIPFYYTVVNANNYAQGGPNLFSTSNRTGEPVGIQLTQVQTRPQVIGPQPFSSLAQPEFEIIVPSINQLLAQRQRPTTPTPETPSATQGSESSISLLDLGYRERVLRVLPLPKLALQEDILTGNPRNRSTSDLPPTRAVSNQTQKILESLAKNIEVFSIPEPVILSEEKTSASGWGERLSNVVQTNWNNQNWTNAIEQITELISLQSDPKLKRRAYFYRAQAYLFSNQIERASLDFIMANEDYRLQVKPFLDYLLIHRNR